MKLRKDADTDGDEGVVREFCSDNGHIIGRWKAIPEHVHVEKSFHCCTWDNNDFLHDTTRCGDTSMYPGHLHGYRGSDEHMTQGGDAGCTCDAQQSRYGANARERYFWRPTHCKLHRWNATLFCELLGNRTVLLVGDSAMEQTAATLMSMITNQQGGCSSQIIMGRNDFLVYALKNSRTMEEFVQIFNPDICVINAGAHMHDWGDMAFVFQHLPPVMQRMHAMRNGAIKFVWKTNNPGHVHCEDYSAPTEGYSKPPSDEDKYQWGLHPMFDEMARNNSVTLGYKVLDMSPLYLRPDAHIPGGKDCLHFCIPGPLDLFAQLMLQMLVNGEI